METILGTTQLEWEHAGAWAASRGAARWFVDLAEEFWVLFPEGGVRPEVGYAQCCMETGFGKFGRAVTPEHHNPCGLKIPDPSGLADDDPNAHQRFPNWSAGIMAHRDHLALYAGAPSYPRAYVKNDARRYSGATWDPRHFSYLWGKAGDDMSKLGGSWAPNPAYGSNLVLGYLSPMLGWAGVELP